MQASDNRGEINEKMGKENEATIGGWTMAQWRELARNREKVRAMLQERKRKRALAGDAATARAAPQTAPQLVAQQPPAALLNLPTELLEAVLARLQRRELLALRATCRALNRLVERMPAVWANVTLGVRGGDKTAAARARALEAQLVTCARRAGAQLQRVELHRHAVLRGSTLDALSRFGGRASVHTLAVCGAAGCNVTASYLRRWLALAPRLAHLRLFNVIRGDADDPVDAAVLLWEPLRRLPKLETLAICARAHCGRPACLTTEQPLRLGSPPPDLAAANSLRRLALDLCIVDASLLDALSRLAPNLESFEIIQDASRRPLRCNFAALGSLQRLETLHLGAVTYVAPSTATTLASELAGASWTNLKTFYIAQCDALDDAAVNALIARHGRTLRRLLIPACRAFSGRGGAHPLPMLERLDVSGCSALRFNALVAFLERCPALTHLWAGYNHGLFDSEQGFEAETLRSLLVYRLSRLQLLSLDGAPPALRTTVLLDILRNGLASTLRVLSLRGLSHVSNEAVNGMRRLLGLGGRVLATLELPAHDPAHVAPDTLV